MDPEVDPDPGRNTSLHCKESLMIDVRRSFPVHAEATRLMTKQIVAMMGPQRDNLSGYYTILGITTTAPYGLISTHGDGYAPDLLTDGITRCLALEQYPDGHWGNGGGQRPLAPETGIPGTALSARAVRLYPVPAMARELEERVARARAYLLRQTQVW